MEAKAVQYREAVARISEALYHTDVQAAIGQAVSTAIQITGGDAAAVFLVNPQSHELMLIHGAGGKDLAAPVGWEAPLAGRIVACRSETITSRTGMNTEYPAKGSAPEQMLVMPLTRWNANPLGVLLILSEKEDRFTENHLEMLTLVSPVLAALLERTRATATSLQTEATLHDAQKHEAQKMEAVGRLAGGIAHDFNNLITVISGYADLLLSGSYNEEVWRRELSHIRDAGQRAAALTRQLLAFSRRQVLKPELLNISSVILNVAGMLQQLVGEDIQVVPNVDDGIRLIEMDRGQLEQVMMNLAANARDAMEHGGRLVFETRTRRIPPENRLQIPPGEYVELRVEDTGCGIEPVIRERIFEPFFTTKPLGKGTGLGLATVYGIVRQSGGAITVTSEVGRGTVFSIYLPATEKTEPHVEVSPAPASKGSGMVLLVEDEPAVRELVSEILKGGGYTVIEARHGLEALQRAAVLLQPPDLVFTDVVMPQMNGIDLVKEIRKQYPNIKVLYMSGYSDHPALRDEILTGTCFLPKPFSAELLTETIHKLIETATCGKERDPL